MTQCNSSVLLLNLSSSAKTNNNKTQTTKPQTPNTLPIVYQIQTHKRFKRTLFIRTKHLNFFRGNPLYQSCTSSTQSPPIPPLPHTHPPTPHTHTNKPNNITFQTVTAVYSEVSPNRPLLLLCSCLSLNKRFLTPLPFGPFPRHPAYIMRTVF